MITTKPLNEKDVWINIEADTINQMPELFAEYDLDDEIVAYALDRNERARVDYDKERDMFVIIYNVANRIKQAHHYQTVPMIFIVQANRLISITNETNAYVLQRLYRYLELNPTTSIFNFLFSSLYMITDEFFPLVEEINKSRDQINQLLREKTTRQNLLALSDLETGVVYFVSASKQNVVLLEQMRTQSFFRALDASEREQLEDSLIEAKQLVEMTQLTSQILSQLSGTYNNVLNNNLNDTMKLLTVLSILITIPATITSYFGMNVPLPWEHHPHGAFYILLLCILGWGVGSFLLGRMMNKK